MTDTPLVDRDYYKPKELADLLQVHPQTLQRLRTRGEGPEFFTVGDHIRYPKDWVEEWKQQSRRRITAPSNRGKRA